jgi:hypothetical protein
VLPVVLTEAAFGQRLGKHVRAATGTNATIEERYFLCGPCRDVISKEQIVQFCMGGYEENSYFQECGCEEEIFCVIFGVCNSVRLL